MLFLLLLFFVAYVGLCTMTSRFFFLFVYLCYIFWFFSLFFPPIQSLISREFESCHQLSWLFYNCQLVDPSPLLIYSWYIWANRFHSPFCLNGVAVDNDITPCSRVHLHSLGASAATEHLLAADRSTRSSLDSLTARQTRCALTTATFAETPHSTDMSHNSWSKRSIKKKPVTAAHHRSLWGEKDKHKPRRGLGIRSARPLFCCLGAAVLKNAWIWIMSIFPTNEPGQ